MCLILSVFVPLYLLCLSCLFFHLWLDIFTLISGHAESCKFLIQVLSLLVFFVGWGRNYTYFKRNIFFFPQKNGIMEEVIFLNKSIYSCGSVPGCHISAKSSHISSIASTICGQMLQHVQHLQVDP